MVLNGNGYISVKVIDVLGREIYSQPIDAKNKYQILNLSVADVVNGVYILQITSDNGVVSRRIVIQK